MTVCFPETRRPKIPANNCQAYNREQFDSKPAEVGLRCCSEHWREQMAGVYGKAAAKCNPARRKHEVHRDSESCHRYYDDLIPVDIGQP